jgi:hypothetical protein
MVKSLRRHGFKGAAKRGLDCFWSPTSAGGRHITCVRTSKDRSHGYVILSWETTQAQSGIDTWP